MSAVPPDVTLTAAMDGAARTVTTVLGQNARITFPGTVDARLFIRLSTSYPGSATCRLAATLTAPDGSTPRTDTCSDQNGFLETVTLTSAGTHTLSLDPAAGVAGTTTLLRIERLPAAA